MFFNAPLPASFLYFRLFNSTHMFCIKICQWPDSNHRPLLSAAIALPTEPQLLSFLPSLSKNFSKRIQTLLENRHLSSTWNLSNLSTLWRHRSDASSLNAAPSRCPQSRNLAKSKIVCNKWRIMLSFGNNESCFFNCLLTSQLCINDFSIN